jgi:hypothetical protein
VQISQLKDKAEVEKIEDIDFSDSSFYNPDLSDLQIKAFKL